MAYFVEIVRQGGVPEIKKGADACDRAVFVTLFELRAQKLQMRVNLTKALSNKSIVQFVIAPDRFADYLPAFAIDQFSSYCRNRLVRGA